METAGGHQTTQVFCAAVFFVYSILKMAPLEHRHQKGAVLWDLIMDLTERKWIKNLRK